MPTKFSKPLLMLTTIAMAGTLPLRADIVNGGTLQTWTASQLTNNSAAGTPGTPYWNNADPGDAPTGNANIGWCLAGGGGCTLPGGAPGVLPYYGPGGSAAPSNLYFTGNIGSNTSSTLLVAITDQKGGGNPIDNLYYYLTNSTGTIISAPILLFSAAAAQNTTVAMTIPVGDGYGFELTNGTVGAPNPNTYLMNDTAAGNTDPGNQHFAVFQQSSSLFYIGAEDAPFASSDKDYNDMVIRLQTTPEPVPVALIGGSLVLLGALVRRSNRNRR